MNASLSLRQRLDIYTLEMIIVLAVITLHDFLLSNVLPLPQVLRHSSLLQLRSLDHVASSVEYLVPIAVIGVMLVLWLAERNEWVRRLAVAYLIWVTLRLVLKISLVMYIIASRPQNGVGVLLKDAIVLWVVIFFLFSIWYWIIDGGGPDARRDGNVHRFDFHFPQRNAGMSGWEDWQPGFWDYFFLGFCGSTQFALGDTNVLSSRAKFLLMLQVTLSLAVIVYIASIAISLIH